MNDIFTFSRGRILLDTENIYEKAFSEARSKTAEHNIYERSDINRVSESKKSRKKTETSDNQS